MKHLRCLCLDFGSYTDWSQLLPLVQQIINHSFHSSIGTTPYKMLYGSFGPHVSTLKQFRSLSSSEMPSSTVGQKSAKSYIKRLDDRLTLIRAGAEDQQKLIKEARAIRNENIEATEFKIGDFVLLVPNIKSPKLHAKLLGPYKVIERPTEVTARVQALAFPDKKEIVHIARLVPFNVGKATEAELRVLSNLDKDHYSVSAILDHTGSMKKDLMFKTVWEGYDGSTMEPYKNFPSGNEILKNYIVGVPALKKYFKY